MSLNQVKKHIRAGCYARALAVLDAGKSKNRPVPLFLRGKALSGLKRYREAADAFTDSANPSFPDAAEAWTRAGICFQALHMADRAMDAYHKALDLDGDIAGARINLCGLLVAESRFAEALPHAEWLLAHAGSNQCMNAAVAFFRLKLRDKTIAAAKRVLEADPYEPRALSIGVRAAQMICDWNTLSTFTGKITDIFYRNGRFFHGREKHFTNISWCMVPEWNLAVAQTRVKRQIPGDIFPYDHSGQRFSSPLRVGYVSADFHDHPFLYLTAGLFEQHDPERVEVFAYCHSKAGDSWYRRRFERAVPNLVRIADLSDEQAASRIRADGIDVLVDCMGFTRGHRQGIFALRPAPVQVTWLGFPGTTGADYMDYIIADPVVAPEGSESCFSEKLCRLPETYQPNDQNRFVADDPLSRTGQSLPVDGIVFCCMNQAYKLEPVRFATFMAILKDVPGSVLWLLDPGDAPRENLRGVARDAGVDPDRLVFAQKEPAVFMHLARLFLADLALDTRIYGGHTTTADALWAGVPVVATSGRHFASRVSGCLLRAVRLPELVARDEDAMQSLAVNLALHPEKLKMVREKLAYNKLRAPLFDTGRFTRHMEAAFDMMADRAAKGLPPAAIDVPALAPRKGPFADGVPRKKMEIRDGHGPENENRSQYVEKEAEKDYTAENDKPEPNNPTRSNAMHIFTDGIKSVGISNNNIRIVLNQNGPENTQNEVATLIVPANQAANLVNAMANGLKQIDEQMKARAAQPEADKNDVQ